MTPGRQRKLICMNLRRVKQTIVVIPAKLVPAGFKPGAG
jgi:hypothetical protein